MSKKILITGANGGFGKLTVLTLRKEGHTVVASLREPEGRNKPVAEELKSAGALVVEMDVTDEASVNRGVGAAIELAGGIDVAINNAGVGVIGLQENFTPGDMQKLFDVNVFGVQRVNRAVLPHMRARRSGLLIYVSSALGRMVFPFYGPYSASKWALEGLAEGYRVELSGFGVDSCLVEPGAFLTTFVDNFIRPSDSTRDAGYGDLARAPEESFGDFIKALEANPEQNPQDVADVISELIATSAGQRPFRTVVDKLGMGDALKKHNEQFDQTTIDIYNAFGIQDALKLKLSSEP